VATIDIDSTIKEVYGECKQGADFSYAGKWSYHPLLVTLAETQEPLRTINRPGNVVSTQGAAEALHAVLPVVTHHFGKVYVGGDSAFHQRATIAASEAHQARFAFVMGQRDPLDEKAHALPPSAWKPFSAHRSEEAVRAAAQRTSRRERGRLLARRARERGYRTPGTTRQWVAEFEYTPPRMERTWDFGLAGRTFRVILRRQEIDASRGHHYLFTQDLHRFVITNIRAEEMDASEVLCFTYGRCDQENSIDQFKNGIGTLRMPTGELVANGAFLMAGQLAWCPRSWLSLLALPKETLRWEWKWFRQAFVYVVAKITQSARRCAVYPTGSHQFVEHVVTPFQRLHSYAFR
jgi:hypothetical protein